MIKDIKYINICNLYVVNHSLNEAMCKFTPLINLTRKSNVAEKTNLILLAIII